MTSAWVPLDVSECSTSSSSNLQQRRIWAQLNMKLGVPTAIMDMVKKRKLLKPPLVITTQHLAIPVDVIAMTQNNTHEGDKK